MYEALALELKGRYQLELGFSEEGQETLNKAYAAYHAWGAVAKCKAIEAEFPGLAQGRRPLSQPRHSTNSPSINNAKLDIETILKASSAISNELVLERLVEKLLKFTKENAGATKALFFVESEDAEAHSNILDEKKFSEGARTHAPDRDSVFPKTVVDFTEETRQPVLGPQADATANLDQDPYFEGKNILSYLSLPLINRGKLIAVLYLENNLIPGAFTQERIEFLNVLSGQIAVSVENAILFRQQEATREQEMRHQRALLQATVDAQEKERNRIAKDLHDDVQVSLLAAKLKVNMLRDQLHEAGQSGEGTEEVAAIVQNTIESVRGIAQNLMPTALRRVGLLTALQELCESFNITNQLDVIFTTSDQEITLVPESQVAIYRVAQELLANGLKHSHASEIRLSLNSLPERILLEYTDNGIGFDERQVKDYQGGLGLKNMESRIALVGGKLHFGGRTGKGCYFRIEVPKAPQNITENPTSV